MKIGSVDVEEFSRNLARLIEEGGRALAAYLKPREDGHKSNELAEEVGEVVKTLGQVAEYWLEDPQRALEAQNRLGKAYLDLWAAAAKRLAGEEIAPVVTPETGDKRFADPEWSSNQYYDFLKQAYLLSARWAKQLVSDAAGLDPHTRQKAEFYMRQITNAVSPSNFVLTNPELLRETVLSNADNLVRGMHMLAEDIGHPGGYCVGGTLLAITLAVMAARHDERVASATLFASQVDFTYAGDLKVFVDEEQISALERKMAERGYLEGKTMATVFNMLRSNDLVWPYVINNYLKGKAPFPFDLLYWNSDATRMPAANHSFYMRNCYLDNKLAKGQMLIDGAPINLKSVTVPIYNLATREDHIAPPKSVLLGCKFFGGPVRFVMAGSGHIAGVVNPPAKNKYQYWTGQRPRNADLDGWLAKAKEYPGSWWPDWLVWLTRQGPTEVPARVPGEGALKAIEDAPGSYVRARD